MLKKHFLKINSNNNRINICHIDEVTFLPNHKYSFVYNDMYYIGFFKKILEKEDKQIYVFNNFLIDTNKNKPSYIFDLYHYKLSPNIARLLKQDTFSDIDIDIDGFESDLSSNYKKILEEQNKDDFDDF